MAKMIGRVGTDPCTQLRRLLLTQERMLKDAESATPKNEEEIRKIKDAIKITESKLQDKGCV